MSLCYTYSIFYIDDESVVDRRAPQKTRGRQPETSNQQPETRNKQPETKDISNYLTIIHGEGIEHRTVSFFINLLVYKLEATLYYQSHYHL